MAPQPPLLTAHVSAAQLTGFTGQGFSVPIACCWAYEAKFGGAVQGRRGGLPGSAGGGGAAACGRALPGAGAAALRGAAGAGAARAQRAGRLSRRAAAGERSWGFWVLGAQRAQRAGRVRRRAAASEQLDRAGLWSEVCRLRTTHRRIAAPCRRGSPRLCSFCRWVCDLQPVEG